MTRLKLLAAAAAIAVTSFAVVAPASAAPVAPAFSKAALSAHSSVQSVYWIHRHGHRIWVRPHHR